jgi:hypothetical protein
LQRRQRLGGLRQRRFLSQNRKIAGGAERPLVSHGLRQLLLEREQPLGRSDLPAQ